MSRCDLQVRRLSSNIGLRGEVLEQRRLLSSNGGASIKAVIFSDRLGDGRTEDDRSVSDPDLKVRITGHSLDGAAVDRYLARSSQGDDVAPGDYLLEVVSESSELRLFSTEPLTRSVSLGAGESLLVTYSIFLARPIEGRVSLPDSEGKSFAGIHVELFQDNGDEVFDPGTDTLLGTQVITANPTYQFENPGPGNYFLTTRLGEQYTPAELKAATMHRAVSQTSPFAPSVPRAKIRGQVHVDANFNNRFEPTERGLGGVMIRLDGFDVFGNSVSKTTSTSEYTDSLYLVDKESGRFSFEGLLPGTYAISQEQPAEYLNGTESAGTFGGTTSPNRIDNIVVPTGGLAVGYRFGEFGAQSGRELRPGYMYGVGVFNPETSFSYLTQQYKSGEAWIAYQFGAAGSQAVVGDWDGNGYDSVGVFEPATGVFQLKNQNQNRYYPSVVEALPPSDPFDLLYPSAIPDIFYVPPGVRENDIPQQFVYGAPGFVAIAGDWDGDGMDSVGVYNPATSSFYLRNSNDSGTADAAQFSYGLPGFVPIVGDWNGDGYDGIGVYDPHTATFFLRNTLTAGPPEIPHFNYGMPGWKPFAGDWDDDGIVTIGVYAPDSATFFLRNSNTTGVADIAPFNYGLAGWEPIIGDWDYDRAATTDAYYRDYFDIGGSGKIYVGGLEGFIRTGELRIPYLEEYLEEKPPVAGQLAIDSSAVVQSQFSTDESPDEPAALLAIDQTLLAPSFVADELLEFLDFELPQNTLEEVAQALVQAAA